MKWALGAAAIGLLCLSPSAGAASQAHPAQKPDLVVAKLQSPPSQLSAGSTFTARDTTKNVGRGTAGPSRTAYFLSSNRKGDHGLALGARAVGKLAPGKSSSGSVTAKVPSSAATGSYFLIACADAAKSVKESAEGNNCRASSTKATVSKAAVFPRPSNPLNVSSVTEDAHVTSALISSAGGGTLVATSATGVTFTLSVPAGAVASDETITMTPVSSVTGSPLGDLVGAVEIEPSGLQLLKAATLTITPPAAVDLSKLAGFATAGGGEDFGLYPLGTGAGIVMSLDHFSTYGAADATDGQAATALSHMPARTEAQYKQLAADIVRRAREAGTTPDPKALAELSAAYYQDIIAPLTNKALTDDTYAAAAVTELLGWAQQMEVLGLNDDPLVKPFFDGYKALLAKILQNAVQQSYQRCIQTDDLSEIIRLISAERQAQLLGIDVGNGLALAQKCAHFELDVMTQSHYRIFTGDQGVDADITVEYAIPISVDSSFVGTGEKDPAYSQWAMTLQFGCCATASGTSVDATSRVEGLGFKYDVVERKQPDGKIVREVPAPTLSLRFDPGLTKELFSLPDGTQSYLTVWNKTWASGHHAELVPGETRLFDLTDWQTLPPGSGPLIATKTYPTRTYCATYYAGCDPSKASDKITETTTLKLYHRPQP